MTELRNLAFAGLLIATGNAALAQTAMLSTADQALGTSVTVASITVAQDGWVVIHQVKDGKPVVPTSICHTHVKAGTTMDVPVALTEAVETGQVIAMLHSDDGERGVYEFGADSTDNDLPVSVDGKVVVAPITISE